MALLEILKAGNPLLKKSSLPVAKVDNKLRRLLDDMAETMHEADGVGLAAPQVGELIRAVVIEVDKKKYELINPVITAKEGEVLDAEGCLSVPNIFGDVERAEKITVEYTNRFGKRRSMTADGLLGRCVQHEVDHLDGVLFIDRAKSLRREEREE